MHNWEVLGRTHGPVYGDLRLRTQPLAVACGPGPLPFIDLMISKVFQVIPVSSLPTILKLGVSRKARCELSLGQQLL